MLGSLSSQESLSSLRQKVSHWISRQLDDRKPKENIASLDGVRALAFLLVLALHINHAGIWGDLNNPFLAALFAVGGTGVTLFFILSGFLLFRPYIQALLFQKDWPQSKLYYLRRVLRIFPGYFFSLFILVMFTKPDLIQPHNWGLLVPFLTFTMGFYNSADLINGPYWTLAVEFQYYLILPLIALAILGLTRLVRPEKRCWVVVGSLFAMIAWGLATACIGRYFATHPDQTFLVPRPVLNGVLFMVYGDHSKFLEDFALGMLIAVAYLSIKRSPRKDYYLRKVRRLLPWLLLPWLALFVYAAMPDYPWPFMPPVLQMFPWLNEFAFALCYGYLVAAVLFNRPGGWLGRLFAWNPLRWLGLISYSLYIWHRPLVQILAANLAPDLQRLPAVLMVSLFWLIALVVPAAFCFVLFVLIERPAIRLSERLRQQRNLPARAESRPQAQNEQKDNQKDSPGEEKQPEMSLVSHSAYRSQTPDPAL